MIRIKVSFLTHLLSLFQTVANAFISTLQDGSRSKVLNRLLSGSIIGLPSKV